PRGLRRSRWRRVDFGFCFLFLLFALSSSAKEAKEDKIKSNTKPKVKTPPVSAEKHRRASPLG
ncbi:hypothetical protein, partial [Cloacibacillus evryensis]|uniref:hypothetical protein n=1 Tax=Cloacibacillus evryensis TaxID=508460 RepID=UPI00210D3B2A